MNRLKFNGSVKIFYPGVSLKAFCLAIQPLNNYTYTGLVTSYICLSLRQARHTTLIIHYTTRPYVAN